jgi:anti-sigma B factor antagonist
MDCVIEERDGVVVVRPDGDLDNQTSPEFQSRLDTLVNRGTRYFVVDLQQVGFLDSSGLAALVRLYKRVRIGEGDVRLAGVLPAVQRILDLTRLSRVFDIFPTAEEAAASIGRAD